MSQENNSAGWRGADKAVELYGKLQDTVGGNSNKAMVLAFIATFFGAIFWGVTGWGNYTARVEMSDERHRQSDSLNTAATGETISALKQLGLYKDSLIESRATVERLRQELRDIKNLQTP